MSLFEAPDCDGSEFHVLLTYSSWVIAFGILKLVITNAQLYVMSFYTRDSTYSDRHTALGVFTFMQMALNLSMVILFRECRVEVIGFFLAYQYLDSLSMTLNIHGLTKYRISTTYIHHIIEATIILIIGIFDVDDRLDLIYWICMFNVVDWLSLVLYHSYAISKLVPLKFASGAAWLLLVATFILGVVDLDGRLRWTYLIGMGLELALTAPIVNRLIFEDENAGAMDEERGQLIH